MPLDADQGVGLHRVPDASEIGAAGSYDDLGDATNSVTQASWGLRRKPLVMVFVTVEHEIDVLLVEDVPDAGHAKIAGVTTRAESWAMEVRDRALLRVPVEFFLQPFFLVATCFGRERGIGHDFAVQRDHFPLAEIEGVIPLSLFTGGFAE